MPVNDGVEVIDGVEMYRISSVDEMDPFLMTIVSNSDLWMFVSSAGGLTAGRVEPERCIFPYETDDRLHHINGRVGPRTLLRVGQPGRTTVWEPFIGHGPHVHRSLLKSLLGNAVILEEHHLELGLTFRSRWAPSDRFGWVRTASLVNEHGGDRLTIEIVDGLLDIMPWGIGVPFQQQMSNLANAYRRSEIVEAGIGVFVLEALIVDRPEPAEALRATVAWSTGLGHSARSVDPGDVATVRAGGDFEESSLRTGRPGSFLVNAARSVEPGETLRWHIVADVAQSHTDIVRLANVLDSADDLSQLIDDDIDQGTADLRNIVAGADGIQTTASPNVDAHHLANTLFNVMRGGTFARGYAVETTRFRTFVEERNTGVANQHAEWFAGLPERIDVAHLRAKAALPGDPNLIRLAHEYLPLSFSRRHGDPSRPWNHFAIRVRDADGDPLLSYQGNWRDIFQNWEALCRSFPGYLPSIISKFVNASTADGFNPYRITDDGIDWEVPEPDNPWSAIGYWGDHQIVYLYRLLRTQREHHPRWLTAELGERSYAFADVPYRIASFEHLVRNPKATVEHDTGLEDEIEGRVDRLGTDGRLLPDADGGVHHVTLLEKLLIPALAKISNFVPRGGIWMNTQRPEWNDANNALVGYGLSMVTLAHLRRYLELIDDVTSDLIEDTLISTGVITWIEQVTSILDANDEMIGAPSIDDGDRFRVVQGLGRAFDDYRTRLYAAGASAPTTLAAPLLHNLLRSSIRHLDDSLRAAHRPDGLYDAYNLVDFGETAREANVDRLQPMLEGQVAAISSGLLDVGEVVALVETMYESDLYRHDVDTFILYPARARPPFLERNQIPTESVESNPLLSALVAAGDDEVITRDLDGRHHFNADFKNATDLSAALDSLDRTEFAALVTRQRTDILDLFEEVFNHHAFTGRSQTMYGFEGIGSVYWHMVAKLLLAIQESILEAPPETDADGLGELIALYHRVRDGLGFNRTAAQYGAFPTDPYSHTPAHAGAQQPGMTGQVKEELLTRWAELGLTVAHGSIRFSSTLFSSRELRTESGELTYLDVAGRLVTLPVPAGAAAFTACRVPVVVQSTDAEAMIVVTQDDGSRRDVIGHSLDTATSAQVFDHTGEVAQLDVYIPKESIR